MIFETEEEYNAIREIFYQWEDKCHDPEDPKSVALQDLFIWEVIHSDRVYPWEVNKPPKKGNTKAEYNNPVPCHPLAGL